MTLPASAYPCPACGAAANLATGCPNCRRGPDPVAAEVIRLDGEIAGLVGRVEQARQTHVALATTLRERQQRRSELASRLHIAAYVGPRTAAGPSASAGAGQPAQPPIDPTRVGARPVPTAGTAPVRPEASTRTVQNLLFILGGLLLGTAAIVFTAVAWTTVGVAGRAVILAAVTMLVLAVPPLAQRRGLTATAETFAAVGLLLVLLDGYAGWAVNLFGVSSWPGARYAALVCAGSALVAVGYRRITRLAGPWFAAILLLQPVPPLLAYDARLGAAGWTVMLAVLAVLNLLTVWRLRGSAPMPAVAPAPSASLLAQQIVAWVAYSIALLFAGLSGLGALLVTDRAGAVLAGLPLLAAVLVLIAGSVVTRSTPFQMIAGAILVIALAVAAIRPVVETRWPLASSALVVAVLAGAVAAAVALLPARLLPTRVRIGPRIGGLVVAGVQTAVTGLLVLIVAVTTVGRSLPPWRAEIKVVAGPFGWQLPVAVLLATVALAVLLPRAARLETALAGGVLVVLAGPSAVAVPWWTVCAVDLGVAVALLLSAVRQPSIRPAVPMLRAGAGAVLTGYAVLVSLARPASAAAVFGALLLAGLAIAATASPVATGLPAHRRVIGGAALVTGLLAAPATAVVGLFAAGVGPGWQIRAGLGTVVLLVAALVPIRRWWPPYLPYAGNAFALAAVVVGLAPTVVAVGEPSGVYAAASALLVAAALLIVWPIRSKVPLLYAGAGLLLRAAVAVAPATLAVLVGPYGWVTEIWSGAPFGVGFSPTAWRPGVPAAVALGLLSATAAVAGWAARRTVAATIWSALPVAAPAILVTLAAAGARWPVVPAVALLGGLVALLAAALVPVPAVERVGRFAVPARLAVPLGVILVGAGLTGLLPTKSSTLVALGLVVVAAAAVGAAGRVQFARMVGWLVASIAAVALAVTASLAVDLPLRVAALVVLGVAAAILVTGTALRGRRPAESVAIEAASHAGAVIALLLTFGEIRYAAGVCTLWGVALGLRALRPAEANRRRWLHAAFAAGSELLAVWLLLTADQVALLEAYTLPAAALGLFAGWLAVRAWPALSSWLAYGPGLAAALLPSLVSVLVAGGQPWRRLLLGAGALVVVLLGAIWRRQAPVLLGGVTLALGALREMAGVWDRLDRWIFLAIGGLILIGLAMTYERRRRDLARLRSAMARMT